MSGHITSIKDIPECEFVVLTNDSFMSGWGQSKNLINTLIFTCEDYAQARIVANNAVHRADQTHIRIIPFSRFKSYKLRNSNHYYQLKTKNDYSRWYIDGYFNR